MLLHPFGPDPLLHPQLLLQGTDLAVLDVRDGRAAVAVVLEPLSTNSFGQR